MKAAVFRSILGLAMLETALVAWPCAGAESPSAEIFLPQVVFAMPDHANIDDRCKDARSFADTAAKGTDQISYDEAIGAANNFALCFRLPKLNPDQDKQRYLILCGAAAIYLAALKSGGNDAAALFKKADSIAALLGGLQSDKTNGVKAVHYDPTSRDSTDPAEQMVAASKLANKPIGPGSEQQVETTTYTDVRDPHQSGQPLKFTGAASQLRAGVAEHLKSIAQPTPPAIQPRV